MATRHNKGPTSIHVALCYNIQKCETYLTFMSSLKNKTLCTTAYLTKARNNLAFTKWLWPVNLSAPLVGAPWDWASREGHQAPGSPRLASQGWTSFSRRTTTQREESPGQATVHNSQGTASSFEIHYCQFKLYIIYPESQFNDEDRCNGIGTYYVPDRKDLMKYLSTWYWSNLQDRQPICSWSQDIDKYSSTCTCISHFVLGTIIIYCTCNMGLVLPHVISSFLLSHSPCTMTSKPTSSPSCNVWKTSNSYWRRLVTGWVRPRPNDSGMVRMNSEGAMRLLIRSPQTGWRRWPRVLKTYRSLRYIWMYLLLDAPIFILVVYILTHVLLFILDPIFIFLLYKTMQYTLKWADIWVPIKQNTCNSYDK